MSQGVAPLRTRFTAIEKAVLGELLSFAQLCAESTNKSVQVLAGLAAERAAKIMRSTAPLASWSNEDIAHFAKVWEAADPKAFSGEERRTLEPWVVRLPQHPGQCRWCGCTQERACASGCGWANREQTLCTACVNFDRLMRSAKGRAQLLDQIGEADLL